MRMIFGKVMWMGRATVVMVGLLAALVLGLALTAGSARGDECADCPPGGGGGGTNLRPTVSVSATSYTVNEGGSVTLSGAYNDADGDTVTVTVDANNDGTYESEAAGDGASSGTWSYTFSAAGRDGPASQKVNIKASDSVAFNTTSTTVNVVNMAPTATFNAPDSVDEGSSIALSLTNATDPSSVDMGSLTYRFDCGTGAGFGLFTASNTASCPTNDSGTRTVKGQVRDKDGGINEYTRTVTINDITAPLVTGSTPTGKGVARNAPLTATFSEQMNPNTLSKSTFKLFKVNSDGTTTRIRNTTVTPSTDGLTATLDPFGTSTTLLRANSKYKAVVTTGAKDLAGNALDQNSSRTGNQSKVWTFTTGSS